jgi:microcystin-dependent protein
MTTQAELLARIEALENDKLELDRLPLAALKKDLEQNWHPDAESFLLPSTWNSPAGCMWIWPGATTSLPDGWLLCDFTAVGRTLYSTLFNIIGTTYGVGDGSTTFNLPDMRGRAIVGSGTGDATGATAHTRGTKYGEETHALTVAQIPRHTHTPGTLATGNESAAHSHNFGVNLAQTNNIAQVAAGAAFAAVNGISTGTQNNASNHTHTVTTGATEDGTTAGLGAGSPAHENRTPSLAMNYIIKF